MSAGILSRLNTQLDCIPQVLASVPDQALRQRPASGKWSGHENLAHLLRHHEIMLERIRRIVSEDAPRLERYNADEDPEWPRYAALATADVLEQLRASRERLIATLEKLS